MSTTPELTAPNPVTAFLQGRGKVPPLAVLAEDLAAAQTALAAAEAAYERATLAAATGEPEAKAALADARASLTAAREAHDDAFTARATAERMAADRSARQNRDERRRLWKKTREAVAERARIAKSIAVEFGEIERLVHELDAANTKLAALAPVPLGSIAGGSVILATGAAVRAEIEIQLAARKLLAKKLVFTPWAGLPDFEAKILKGNGCIEDVAQAELARLDDEETKS